MDLAEAVAAAYPLGPIRACERIDRESSSVARVELADRVYWLKLAPRALDDLESEAEVASELAQRGLQVTAPVRRCDGRYAGTIGRSPALLFDEAPGIACRGAIPGAGGGARRPARSASRDRCSGGGPPLAHRCGCARRGAFACGRGVAEPRRPRRRSVRRAREARGGDDRDRMAGRTSLPRGLCHGDVQLENVRFDGARPRCLIWKRCGHRSVRVRPRVLLAQTHRPGSMPTRRTPNGTRCFAATRRCAR